jgi:hypothetical protein
MKRGDREVALPIPPLPALNGLFEQPISSFFLKNAIRGQFQPIFHIDASYLTWSYTPTGTG